MLDISFFWKLKKHQKNNTTWEWAFSAPQSLSHFVAWTSDTRYERKRQERKMRVNKSHRGSVFLVDPHAFERHSASQTQRGQCWQTWSDTMDVLRNRLSPEIPSTYSWTVVVHENKFVVLLLVLPSSWQTELCGLCQEDTQHHRAPDGYLRSQKVCVNSLWRHRKTWTCDQVDILGFTSKIEISK